MEATSQIPVGGANRHAEQQDSVTQLEARLAALERVQRDMMEHIVRLRSVLGARCRSLNPIQPTSFADAMERIEELEIRLEDALAPPEPLPPGLEQRLSPIEAKLYGLLKRKACEDSGAYVRKDAIMTVLYGLNDDVPSTAGLHVHVCHLRRKLPSHEHIETVRGRGWRLISPRRESAKPS